NPRRRDRRTLERRFPASLARRDSAQARSGEYCAGRGCIAHCNRHRAAAEGAEFRAARGALAGEVLSLNRPTRRRPCRARVSAQGLFADPGISRDRGSADATRRPDAMSQSNEQAREGLVLTHSGLREQWFWTPCFAIMRPV